MTSEEFVAAIAGRLIVSCQAGPGHPMRDSATIARLARAAVAGGAASIRAGGYGGLEDVAAVRAAVSVPLIGLTKEGSSGVYITPTAGSARAVLAAGADVVAVDATRRPRPDGRPLADTVATVHELGGLVLADVAGREDALAAAAAGADALATTLAGYVDGPPPAGPDLELVAELCAALPGLPVIAEGRYSRPFEVALAIRAGALAVVVGSAITDPAAITAGFAAVLPGAG